MRLLHELIITRYFYCPNRELIFACHLGVTAYFTSCELAFTYELKVTIYCANYELLFIARVVGYFLHMSRLLLFIVGLRVTSYIRFTLRVTVYCTSYKLLFFAQVKSYFLTMSYDQNKDDKDAMTMMSS